MDQALISKWIHDGDRAFEERADRDIEINRKGNFELMFVDKDRRRIPDVAVEAEMTDLDFNLGSNLFMLGEYPTEAQNRAFEEKFTGVFNSAAVPLYWEGTEPEPGYLRYKKGSPRDVYRRPPLEECLEFCEKNGLKMKGHPLFWHEYIPSWLPERWSELMPLIVHRFEQLKEVIGDRIPMFDVVNEPSKIYDVYMRNRALGMKYIIPPDNYIEQLFSLAKATFPSSKLIINDVRGAVFNEFRGKYSGYYLLVEKLLSEGVPVDEIGCQCHIDTFCQTAYNSERLYDVLDTYATLGKTINISEISVASRFDGEDNEELQALALERLYKACFSHKAVTGLTWWNMPDDGVLIDKKRVVAGENMPSTGLLDGNYREKAAYKTLKRLVGEWRTDFSGKASSDGLIRFRGFYGKYRLKLTYGGKTVEKTVALDANLPNVRPVIL